MKLNENCGLMVPGAEMGDIIQWWRIKDNHGVFP